MGRQAFAGLGLFFWLLPLAMSPAAEPQPLPDHMPDPLTLEMALRFAARPHPEIQKEEAELAAARAEALQAESRLGTRVWVDGRLRYTDPVVKSGDWTRNDSQIGLFFEKRLFDFGRSSAALSASRHRINSRRTSLEERRQARRIAIFERFFDVVQADLQFDRDNEEMAVVFVALDRLRKQHKLGQVSDIEVLEKEAEYQHIRRLRAQTQNRQRLARARLAYAMGLPGQLPATVVPPDALPQVKRPLPEVERLQELAMKGNHRLRALREELAAARERVDSARAERNPTLDARAEANRYSRSRTGYDNWRVKLELKVPLHTGGQADADIASERADVYRLQAELADTQERIRQQVLELWLDLNALRIQRKEAKTRNEYRELYLDRSRALYELEVKTDLGDAMVRLSEAQRQALETDFRIALAWERLDLLLGNVSAIQGVSNGAGEH